MCVPAIVISARWLWRHFDTLVAEGVKSVGQNLGKIVLAGLLIYSVRDAGLAERLASLIEKLGGLL